MFCQPLSKVIFKRCRTLLDFRALQSQLQCRDFGLIAGVRLEADQLKQLVEEARQPGKIGRPKKTVETGKRPCFKGGIEGVIADGVPSLCKSYELQSAATSSAMLRRTASQIAANARQRSRTKAKNFDLDVDFILGLDLEATSFMCLFWGGFGVGHPEFALENFIGKAGQQPGLCAGKCCSDCDGIQLNGANEPTCIAQWICSMVQAEV